MKNEHQINRRDSQSAEMHCYTHLDLFSGIGGFALGLERTGGFRTIAFCEIEKYPRSILRKHWPDVPIFEDVRELHAEELPCLPDVITGGYPCQPFSVAGKRRGQKDDRHLWPEIMRIIRELDSAGKKPTWCLFENVAGHISMGLDHVLADLEGEDYTCWPIVIPACAVNAPHRRYRVWIIAYSSSSRCEKCYTSTKPGDKRNIAWGDLEKNASNSNSEWKLQQEGCFKDFWRWIGNSDTWNNIERKTGIRKSRIRITESPVCGPDDGIPDRVARLKALGNAVVPQIPEIIGRAILSV